jgi:hypothetical protein
VDDPLKRNWNIEGHFERWRLVFWRAFGSSLLGKLIGLSRTIFMSFINLIKCT